MLLQIATNFCNDWADGIKGTDDQDRVGPTRATQAGLISPQSMARATFLTFLLSVLVCVPLVFRGGWPIALIGVTGLLSGIFYTAGPRPLGYLGLGDLFVFLYFGWAATAGPYYIQTGHVSMDSLWAGSAAGLLAVAILVMNNLRDREGDARANKRTLAVRFGVRFSQWQYLLCLLIPQLIAGLFYAKNHAHVWGLLPFLLLPESIRLIRRAFSYGDPVELVPMLGQTARLLLLYSVLFSVSQGLGVL